MKLEIKRKIRKELRKYKNLNQYALHFSEYQSTEHPDYLCNLTIWFRYTFDKAGIMDMDLPEFFGWGKERTEDFETWGHNSRWHHSFWGYLVQEFNEALEFAIGLADKYGDVDVESVYFNGGKKDEELGGKKD